MSASSVKILILVAALGAFAAMIAGPWAIADKPGVMEAVVRLDGEWVDRPAPDFELLDVDSGQAASLSSYRGKVVFLNFWASYCVPCRKEMPSMEELVRQYRNRGLVMVAVSLDVEQQDIGKFMDEFLPNQQSQMTVLWDPNSQSSAAMGTELIPETYIIDRDGQIVARFVSDYDWTRPEVKQLIEALL
ncbi:peroxiredoxin family protein [Bradymonas sediminis]|uniref:TlpA family protein disulfide reductase n=1 Tax=Bradymonas sediminis TaxID=1548548 RepID=A0A2Z4FMF2_9DELT|nr:TlpA disulfide reductase family protein [Bradymonas sediminis]AWV90151.1 TlpA family protein disulfide reductase [Bradymonas sediminis]TDP75882.1 peroxiredoxin [Bradymonas sediminis]